LLIAVCYNSILELFIFYMKKRRVIVYLLDILAQINQNTELEPLK